MTAVLRVLAVVVAAGSVVGAALSAPGGTHPEPVRFHGTAARTATEVSANWSGYVATGHDSTALLASRAVVFKGVTATWRQPAAKCGDDGTESASAVWVGLGGYSGNGTALEQVGTAADCDRHGKASYSAWFELLPDPAITIKRIKVVPGDTITASVSVDGDEIWLWLKNRTRNLVFSRRVTVESPDLSSAEWITEAPAECSARGFCRQVPLANFGSVTLTRVAALATIEGLGDQGGTITTSLWQTTPIQLVPDAAQGSLPEIVDPPRPSAAAAGAAPFPPAADGRSFRVDWLARPTAAG